MDAVTFPDLASARAAFTLGPLTYRCLVCGRLHEWGAPARSLEAALRKHRQKAKCLDALFHGCRWQAHPGPLPPRPVITPALAFVADCWEAGVGQAKTRLQKAVIPGEFVLALDPAANVYRELREYFAGEVERTKHEVAHLWEEHCRITRWHRELLAQRPPAVLVDTESVPAEVPGFSEIVVYHVRPVLPLGDGFALRVQEVSYIGLLKLMGCRSRTGLEDVLAVEYGRDVFSVVVGIRSPWKNSPPSYLWFAVYRERYGRQGQLRYFRVEGDPQELFRSLVPGGA